MQRFQDKTILITGGTSGIGLASAQRIEAEGGQVLVTGSRDQSIVAARQVLSSRAQFLRNDVAQVEEITTLEDFVQQHGPLDGAFLNAGFGRFAPLGQISAEEIDAHYAVNVRGLLLQAQALQSHLREPASLLLTTSVAREMGLPAGAVYTSTKGAVRTLTRALARELAPQGVRVNAVSPGPISTGFFARTGMPESAIAEFGEQILSQVPLGRFGTPAEVAAVAAFLLADEAGFVTGSEYVVDGGMSEL